MLEEKSILAKEGQVYTCPDPLRLVFAGSTNRDFITADDRTPLAAVPAHQEAIPRLLSFSRLGEFYESFDDDAKKGAEACDIVFAARKMGTGQRVLLAGVPYYAVRMYLVRF